MAQTIQLKRSPGTTPPTTLAPGEPAWLDGSNTLYMGKLGGGIQAIAGDGAGYLKSLPTINITGDVTGSGKEQINVTLANIVTAGSGTKVNFNAKGLVTGTSALVEADIPALGIGKVTGLQAALDSKPTLDANGKLPSSALPPLAISDTFVVASQAAMLALTAERGDVAVRTDGGGTFILTAEPATTLANWQQLASPGAGVTSVNGETGSVNLDAAEIPFSPIGNIASTTTQAAIAELDAEKVDINQTFTFTGDVAGTGSAAANIALTLSNTVTGATATKVTFNNKGLITASGNLVAADIPELAISKITGLQAALDAKLSRTEVIDGGTF